MPRANRIRSFTAAATALALAATSATPVLAAQQGQRGNQSVGQVVVSAQVPKMVKISNLDDIDLGEFDGSEPVGGNDPTCVWSNNGGYKLTAESNTGNAQFTMTDGNNTLRYQVSWAQSPDQTGFSSGTELTEGGTQTFASTNFQGPNCGGDANTTLLVQIPTQDQENPAASTGYQDTLTLTVEPQ
jgi:hypothetical protein